LDTSHHWCFSVTGVPGELYLPFEAFFSHLEGGECLWSGAGLSPFPGSLCRHIWRLFPVNDFFVGN